MDRPGTNPGLHGESPATNRLKHDKATKTKMNLHYTQSFSSYLIENRVCFITKTHQLLLYMEKVFIVRIVRNTYIHCVGRMERFLMLQQEMNVLTTNNSSFSNTVYFSVALWPNSGLGRLVVRFLGHTHTHFSTPLNEWSAHRRGRNNNNTQQTPDDERQWSQPDSNPQLQQRNGRKPTP